MGWGGCIAHLLHHVVQHKPRLAPQTSGSILLFECARVRACVCVSVSVGGESGGTLMWGRGGAVPPPVFEDERNVRRRPFSFAQGGTCLARSRPTTSSLAGGRAGGNATTGRR